MTFWLLYIIVMLPSVGSLFLHIAAASTVAIAIFSVAFFMATAEESPAEWIRLWKRNIKIAVVVFIISLPIGLTIPTTHQMYSLVGGYYVINMEGVSDLPPKVVAAMNTFLDTYNGAEK